MAKTADNYSINLEQISLNRFKQMLATKDLLPGRVLLRDDLDARFNAIAKLGINNMLELSAALKTKKRLDQFVEQTGLPEDYVVLVRREVSSYVSKPVNLDKPPNVNQSYICRFADADIKTTKHLFGQASTPEQRRDLSTRLDIPLNALEELTRLSDLSRIIGIGPISARLLLDAGIDSVEAFANTSTNELVEMLNASIAANPQYAVNAVTEKDIAYCREWALLLPKSIVY